MVKNEHSPAVEDDMLSFAEKHSEIEKVRSRVQALLRSFAGRSQADKPLIIGVATAAMEELLRMAQAGEPLWIPSSDSGIECLSKDEYLRSFPKEMELEPMGIKSEASRESAIITMNQTKLVEILMDVNQWSTVFADIVSRAATIDVLSTGTAGNYNGTLQVMTAEFQVLSPLVPTREYYFVRYCKQHEDGTWAVADVSLDNLSPAYLSQCRRRPSGCLIQELPNGCSKVTWVEHAEVDDRTVHHIYRPLVDSGLAFGAKRWVTTLNRQCQRLLSGMVTNIQAGNVGAVMITIEGKQNMLKLAERMVLSFCTGAGTSTAHVWSPFCGSGDDDARIMTRNNIDDTGKPRGIAVSAAASFWIPAPPRRIFDFLRDDNSRSVWDLIPSGGLMQEIAHVANGRDPGSCVSLLQVYNAGSSQSNIHILQESCADSTVSYLIYAPVDIDAVNKVLNGGNPDGVPLLPVGFAILPDGPIQNVDGMPEIGSGGSLLTVAFQLLVDLGPTEKFSARGLATINSLIRRTAERIKRAVGP